MLSGPAVRCSLGTLTGYPVDEGAVGRSFEVIAGVKDIVGKLIG